MVDELKNNEPITSVSEGVSKSLVFVLTCSLSLLVYTPLLLARDKLPGWILLFLEPRLVISGVLLIGLGIYIAARAIRR